MNRKSMLKPDYLFEVSWEVCNKLGGIYTVISTKVPLLNKEFRDNYILVGPDVWKETGQHPDFIEDPQLLSAWHEKALAEGLIFRVGRWNIDGKPIVILVDFTPLFSRKNEIFATLWEQFHLDSLSGQWDYVEPALFGYAAARVIESYYDYYLSAKDKLLVQFHEWMTGTGVLYLSENVPQAATLFTTHATVLGRSMAGRGLDPYGQDEIPEPDALAQDLGVMSKYSLEKTAAWTADCFTTVSEVTARECRVFLRQDVDLITPNGFDESLIFPASEFPAKRTLAREKIFQVVGELTGQPVEGNPLLVLTSGRYEFRNKGIDVFIEGLAELNHATDRQIIAVIAVPTNHAGPDRDLRHLLKKQNTGPIHSRYLTHYLHDEGNDPVIRTLIEKGLMNRPEDLVKVVFVPAYLDGRDGIFNLAYYDFLTAFDLTVFPSFYEPWGYTPLESAAFGIPSLTTSLAGFGQWIMKLGTDHRQGISVLERNNGSNEEIVAKVRDFILEYSRKSPEEKSDIQAEARKLSLTARWTELLENYRRAYSLALGKSTSRASLYRDKRQNETHFLKEIPVENKPVWNKIFVEPSIPLRLEKLLKLSRNLWWSWNFEAEDLFASIDPRLWLESGQNPIALLESLTIDQLKTLENKPSFLAHLDNVYASFEKYMEARKVKPDGTVAYFSMEFGIHDTLKIYSGGLGILAGDYLKEASDSNRNIVGVGLLYRYGYFRQSLSVFGDQIAEYTPQKFTHLPISPVRDKQGEWITLSVALPGRNLFAKAWVVEVGSVQLYLLDTDIPENQPQDRTVTHQLYGGDLENRFMQELLLGVCGIRLLRELDISVDIYHVNEGHAAFIGLERLRTLIQRRGLTFSQAVEVVRSSTLFTTHTPVPAGHDAFPEDLLRTYLPHYASRLGISWKDLMSLGRRNPEDDHEKFSMSILALKLSQEVNGVSKIHGQVSREMFQPLFEGFFAEELHIGHITNGVHLPTWATKQWQELYRKALGNNYLAQQTDPATWEKIHQVDDKEIWKIRNHHRKELISYMSERIMEEFTRRQENPNIGFRITDRINEKALTIGFARRFATYKRAHLLFTNPGRLSNLMNDPARPVQIIFAGKAHPADKAGQDLIRKIVEISRKPEFIGRIFYVENYDISLARKMLSGVDVWLNTPMRPMEASGTSGEKAVMNGTLNLSVLDGWWAEGYKPGAGWGLQETTTFTNQQYQDELDAETIYDILEEEVIPAFYERRNGVPEKWIKFIRNTISGIVPHFTMKRMLDDYQHKYYDKMLVRSRDMKKDHCKLAKDIEAWKVSVAAAWPGISVRRMAVPDPTKRPLALGDDFVAEIELGLNGLKPEDVTLDVLFGQKEGDSMNKLQYRVEMEMVRANHDRALFTCRIPMERVGVFDYAVRITPKNQALPHKQDFPLVKWV